MREGWKTAKLSELCDIQLGKTPARANSSYWDQERSTGNVWLSIADLLKSEANNVSDSKEYLSDKGAKLCKIVKKGTLLVSFKLTLGRVAFAGKDLYTNEAIAALIIHDEQIINRDYLFYFLHFFDWVKAAQDDVKLKGMTLNKAKLKEILVVVPPLPEQKRIVAILDEAFAGIATAVANTEKNLANARELFESYLQNLFSKNEAGWRVKSLESFSNIVNGYAFKSGDFSHQNEVKSIKITNVGVYEFRHESDNYLPKNYIEEYRRYKAYEGDVVVALTRTIISSGLKVAVVPAEYDGALINQRVAAVQVNEEVMPKQILQAFLSTRMAVDYVRSNVNELMQPNLSIKDLKAFPIPVPPADKISSVANQITEIRDKADQLSALNRTKLDSLKELKQTLLQKAFSGELTAGMAAFDAMRQVEEIA